MADGDYKVIVDVDVKKEQLDDVEKKLKSLSGKDQKLSINVDTSKAIKDITALENRVKKLARTINSTKFNLGSSTNMNSGISNEKKQAQSTIDTFQRLIAMQGKMNKASNVAGGLSGDKLVKFNAAIRKTESEYNRLYSTVAKKLNTNQIAQLNSATGSSLPAVKQTINAWNELKRVTKEVTSVSGKLAKLDGNADANKVRELTSQLENAKRAYEDLRNSLKGQLSFSQYEQLNSELTKTENKIKEVEAGILDAKRKMAEKISTGLIAGGDTTKSYNNVEREFRKITEASSDAVSAIERVRAAKQELDSLNNMVGPRTKEDEVAHYEKQITAQKEYEAAVRSANNIIKENIAIENESAAAAKATATAKESEAKKTLAAAQLQQKAQNLILSMDLYRKNNSKIKGTLFDNELKNFQTQLEKCDAITLSNVAGQFDNFKKRVELANQSGLKFSDRLKKQFTRLSSYFGASSVIMAGVQATRKMFESVRDVDTAMTELKRVTDLSSTQYSDLYSELTVSSREYGTTLKDIINATADWSRSGFDANTAKGLAEVTTMYQHIADVDYQTSFENLETAYKGFETQLKQDFGNDTVAAVSYIGDILNELSNNFAVTADGVGEAIKRSASALSIAGNTIQETAGMVTGITEVTQDPEKAGNALKVLSMRLRGTKGELEDLGEDVDENVTNLTKMQGQVLNLTHGHVDIFGDTGEFKSTYEIMQGIAEIYDELSSVEQADLLETIAGKHRANDVAALISNWDQVASATENATEATGSAEEEHAKYLDSIQGKLNALTSVWETFSNTFMNSDLVKGVITDLTEVLNVIEKIISTTGIFGTSGILSTLFFGINKRNGIKNIISEFFGNFSAGISAGAKKLDAFNMSLGNTFKNLSTSQKITGTLAGIGVVTTILASIATAVEAHKEAQRQARQEIVDTANTFNDSFGSFEQAYIKYADKTVLSADEENELKSAIDGTVNALGDKSSALKEAIGSSSEYINNLSEIAKAELTEQERLAKDAKQAAKENLIETASQTENFGATRLIDIKLPDANSKEYKAVEDLLGETQKHFDTRFTNSNWIEFGDLTDIDNMIAKYNSLIDLRDRLNDENLIDNDFYKDISKSIDTLSSGMDEYIKQTYNAEKASYQLKNGIATNEEEFYAMREAILSSASASVEVRSAIGDIMNEQYKDTFDLSSVESKIDYIKSVTKDISDIGGKDEATFETLLDLKTKVNNGECSVGDYVSQIQEANDAIGSIENEDAQEFLRVQLGLELDSDGNIKDDIKKTRDKLINDLKNSGVAEDVATSFTDSLSSKELVVAQDLLVDGELDLKHLDSDKVKKQIAELAEHNEALQFNVYIKLETENLEKLNAAVSESLSGTGISSESMIKVKKMFKGLDGYDPSKLFERTANGIRLNTEEFKKMNNEYKNTNIEGLNKKLSDLGDEYNKTNEELTNLTYGTDEYKEKASELSGIEAQINAAEELAAQYEGLASKYNEWQQVEAAGSQRDMYESILSGFENVKDEISRGWVDDGTIEFIELLSGKDLSSGNIDKIRDAYESLDETIEGTTYSVKDFFTANEDGESTSDGVYNFLEAVDQKFQDSNIIQKDENGNVIGFDFKVAGGDKAIADALGISEELVQIMVRAADDAGFVVSMDGTFQNLDILKDKAQDAANTLKKMFEGTDKEITTDFNLQTNDENSIMEQYKSALNIWEQFKQNKNADGTINMNVEGAEEAFTLVSTLQSMVDKLSEPAYMSINVSEVDKNMQKPLSELQQYERLTQQEHQLKLKGTDTSEIEKSKGEILDYFQDIKKNQPEIAAKLGIDKLSKEELEQKLNDGSLEVDAALNLQVEMNGTLRDQVNVALYSAGIIDKEELEKRVDVDVYAENVDTSDVKEKTEEAVENSGDDDSKTETTADVEVKAGYVDTSDVKDKTEEAISDESEKDSTVEKSVDLEVSVEEYKEIIDELNDANKDIEINVKINGLDDVEKLTSDIDIAAKVDGSVHDLTEYAEAAKQLSDIDDNITKTVSASLYGNLDRNENIGSLQQFIDGAKELEDVDSSFVTITANFSGNLDENAKSIENMPKFAEGAKALQGTPSSSVTIEANLKGDGVGNDWLGNNSTLDNIEKFAESAERLRGVGDASVTVEANLRGDGVGDSFWTGDNSALDNLDKFAESAKKLQGVGSADVTVKANLEANGVGDNFFTGNNSALDNLDKFAESAERLNGIEDADVSVKANLDSNIGNDFFSDSNSTLDNLKKFAEGAESLKNVGDVSASVTANLNSSGVADNFFTGSNSVLDNLEKYAEGAEKIKGVGDVSASVSANLTSTGVADNIFGNNSVIDNLSDFADGAEKLKGVEDVSVSIDANLESTGVADNIFGDNSVLDNLDKFAESARNLQGVEGTSVTVTANLNGNIGDGAFGTANSKLANLSSFVDGAKRLNGVEDESVTITANINGNVGASSDAINNLPSFASTASTLQNVNSKTVAVTANVNGNITSDNVTTLSQFGAAVSSLPSSTTVSVNTNVDIDGISNIKSTLQGLSDSGVMHNYSASVTVTTNVDSSVVDSYSPPSKDGTAIYYVDSSNVDAWSAPTKTGTITYTPYVGALTDSQLHKTGTISYDAKVVGAPAVNGTANVNVGANRAFSKGDWGTKDSGVALMGELGQELIVRDGRFFTVGDNGAEFAQYKKGDIIFNHKQTEELFKNGYVASGGGRGRALVEGTAFRGGSSGHGGWGRPGGGSSSGSVSSSSRSSYSSSNSGSSDSSSDDAEDFEETLDWIEIKIKRIERAISKLDLKASSVYKKWSTRNAALADEIVKVSEEIDVQSAGADRYLQQANNVGLSEDYASKVRDGTIDIETIYDKDLKEKISDYQTWYEKYLDCIDACEELKEKEADLYHQRFENVSTEYDDYIAGLQNWKSVLEEKVNVNETRGYIVNNDYYKELQDNEHQQANRLREERDKLIAARDDAVNSGSIEEGSKDWNDMNQAIDDVTLSIYECQTAWWEYEKTMRETDWKIFDLLQEKVTNVADETQFLIDLLDNKKLYEDNGQLTDEGMAQMGLHGIKYDTYMYQADKYREEMNKLDKQIAEDPYNQDLISRRQELLKLQQESISAAEDEKNAIKDMVEEGINKELDSLQKLIDKYNDALDSQRDLYDYQKKVQEQADEISKLEKQMSAYKNDDSEESKKKIQQIKVDLKEARDNLEETEYDKYVSDQKKLLDELYNEYETILNERLDNIDLLVSDMITEINNNAGTISSTVHEAADNVGYTLTPPLEAILTGGASNTQQLIGAYGDTKNAVVASLNTINQNILAMVAAINARNQSEINDAKKSTAANTPVTKPEPPKQEEQPQQPQQEENQITIGGQINAGDATIYADSEGNGAGRQYFADDPIYTVLDERNGYVLTRWHGESSGYTGWFWKDDVSAYASGKKKLSSDELAWTQENGAEMIVRPSDGAILTPLAKNDSVLNANASRNIWSMANSPSDFIRDNLDVDSIKPSSANGCQTTYTQNLENVVFNLPNVKNYDELLSAMQRDRNFERLINSMTIDRMVGKSTLAKGKAIR